MDIEIIEVGLRDGFQNIKSIIPTDKKIKLVNDFVNAGIKKIQLGSFVNPKLVPQMADTGEVVKAVLNKYKDIEFSVLTPNFKGFQKSNDLGVKNVSFVVSLSETHNKANVNKTHKESFNELKLIYSTFSNINITLDIATAFVCPFEGEKTLDSLLKFIETTYKIGVRNFNLCDTIGAANPLQIKNTVTEVLSLFNDCNFQIHIHDTRNMGIINTYTAITSGIKQVQTTIGGLGGCPFAPGASGNTSTEDLVYLLDKMKINTNIDFHYLLAIAKNLYSTVDGNYSGHHIKINCAK